MKKILTIALMVAASAGLRAQQDAEYSMYMFNGLFLNPAYAGSHEVVALTAIYRHQWVGVPGAPRTFNISAHSPLRREQYGLGLTISNDKLGLDNVFSVTPAFSYRLRVGKKNTRICFGLQASFSYYSQKGDDAVLTDPSADPSFYTTRLFLPNFGAGIYVYGDRYFVGASVPHLLPNSLRKNFQVVPYKNDDLVARQYNHYLFTAGVVIGKKTAIVKFKPTVLMKFQQGLNKNIPQFDGNLNFLFIDRIWLGVGYRSGGSREYYGDAIVFMLEGKVLPQLRVGYAYDWTFNSKLKTYTTGTHEVMLAYDFWYDKKRFVTPRYVKYF